nr:hypothetical protein [Tanacetum cinerariifolium]
MTTSNVTSSTDSQMHNNIMAAGSRDRPPMLAPGRYPQWHLRFLQYVDTRPNGEALRKCILSGPYKPTTVLVHAVEATDDSPAVLEHTTVETPTNMSPKNKAHFQAEKEAIHLILTGIGDDIYSIVDACQTAQEMWKAIERLQQGQRLISSTTSAGMVKEVPTADLSTDSEPVEQNDQNDVESDDERVALTNLIANLKLDVDENKKIQKQLKKANTTLDQELKECKTILAETTLFRAPTAQDIEILIQTCLMPLAIKTQSDSLKFVHELKQEMHADLKYVESLEKGIDKLKSEKAEFSEMYDVILQDC